MPTLVIAYSRIKCSFTQDLIVGKKINCQPVRLVIRLGSEKGLLAAASLGISSKWLLEAHSFAVILEGVLIEEYHARRSEGKSPPPRPVFLSVLAPVIETT